MTSPTRPSAPMAARRTGFGPPPAAFSTRGQDDRFLAVGHGLDDQRRALWSLRCGDLGRQRLIDFAAGKLASGAQRDLEETLVGRAELLDEQREPCFLPGENRAASRLEDSLLGNFGLADFVVDLRRFGRLALGEQSLGAQDAAFGHRRTDFDRRGGQRSSQRFGGGGIADASQGHGRGRRDFGVLILQSRDQALRRRRRRGERRSN